MALEFKQVKERHEPERGTDVDESALVNRVRTFQVVLSNTGANVERSVQADDFEVINEFSRVTGIRRGTAWQSINNNIDLTCRAVSLSAKQDEAALTWTVTVKYSSVRATGGRTPRLNRERAAQARRHEDSGQPPDTPPTLRPPVYRWGSQEYERALEFDMVDFRPIWNAARDRFVPPPVRTYSYRVLTVEKNLLAYDPFETALYENTVNSVAWQIREPLEPVRTIEPEGALCKSITGERDHEGGENFTRVTYVFWIEIHRSWKLELTNMGFNYLNAANFKVPILDPQTGQLVSSPQLLKADGSLWRNGDPMPDPLEFNQFSQMNFNLLGL